MYSVTSEEPIEVKEDHIENEDDKNTESANNKATSPD